MTEIINLINPEQKISEKSETFFLEKMAITLTKAAIDHFLSLLKEPESQEFIRIGVRRSEVVHGFQYLLNFVGKEDIDQEEDIIADILGIKFVMDIFSKEYLKETTIDFIRTLQDNGFKFSNNNVKKTCRMPEVHFQFKG